MELQKKQKQVTNGDTKGYQTRLKDRKKLREYRKENPPSCLHDDFKQQIRKLIYITVLGYKN